MIISLSGKAGSGKDTVGNIFIKAYNFKKFAFADILKDIASDTFKLDIKYFHDVTLKDTKFRIPLIFSEIQRDRFILNLQENNIEVNQVQFLEITKLLGKELNSPREILLFLGTEVGRNCVNNMLWVNIAENKLKTGSGHFVVTDTRFINELNLIKSLGGRCGIVKRNIENTINHISETEFETFDFDFTVNNITSLTELNREITLFGQTLGLR
jgi:hypothetical protein